MTKSNPDVQVAIVTYNSQDVIEECLVALIKSLEKTHMAFRICVVDNASTDNTPTVVGSLVDKLGPQRSDICLVRQESNCGWSSGNNKALAGFEADYALILNPDVRMTPIALGDMVKVLEEVRSIGAVAPSISTDGRIRPGAIPIHRPFRELLAALGLTGLRRKYVLLPVTSGVSILEGGYLAGCCMLIRRSALESVGMKLDERYFMYCDDEDISRELKGAGWLLAVVSDTVEHLGDSSALKKVADASRMNAWKRYTHLVSLVFLFEKWYGMRPAWLLRVVWHLVPPMRFGMLWIPLFLGNIGRGFSGARFSEVYLKAIHKIEGLLEEYRATTNLAWKYRVATYVMPDDYLK